MFVENPSELKVETDCKDENNGIPTVDLTKTKIHEENGHNESIDRITDATTPTERYGGIHLAAAPRSRSTEESDRRKSHVGKFLDRMNQLPHSRRMQLFPARQRQINRLVYD